MTSEQKPPRKRKTPNEARDRWFLVKDMILVTLGVAVVVGTFAWAIMTGETHLEWLGFAITLFTIYLATGLDRRR